jgi:hypothetical protein
MAEPASMGDRSKRPDEIAQDVHAGRVTPILARIVQMSRDRSKFSEDGPSDETEEVTKASASTLGEWQVTRSAAAPRNELPQLKSRLSVQRNPPDGGVDTPAASKCKMKGGPTYSPSGKIKATKSGGMKNAAFALSAEFENDASKGTDASGCEIRQYILWTAGTPPNHDGFKPAASYSANTWYEDRDGVGKRYGHRTGAYSECIDSNHYEDDKGKQDCAKGAIYKGADAPVGAGSRTGEWRFQLKAVDTSDGKEVGTMATVAVDWDV